jgi:hypothetical protein
MMMHQNVRNRMSLPHRPVRRSEPNRRQEIAVQRVDLAVSELASVVMSCSPSNEEGKSAVAEIRNAVAPVLARILSEE